MPLLHITVAIPVFSKAFWKVWSFEQLQKKFYRSKQSFTDPDSAKYTEKKKKWHKSFFTHPT